MRRSLLAAGLGVAAGVAWRKVLLPWERDWGATDEEVAAELAGDALTTPPVEECTRAITIAAPPEAVWPWLVQMGADRGGFYSYAWMENLFGLQIRNADRIHDEWQQLTVGDPVWGDRRRRGGWVVEHIEPNVALVLKTADPATGRAVTRATGIGFEFQWTFALRPTPAGDTRLLIRERTAYGRRSTRWLMAPVGLVSFVMTRKMLDSIRVRVESASVHDRSVRAPAPARSWVTSRSWTPTPIGSTPSCGSGTVLRRGSS